MHIAKLPQDTGIKDRQEKNSSLLCRIFYGKIKYIDIAKNQLIPLEKI